MTAKLPPAEPAELLRVASGCHHRLQEPAQKAPLLDLLATLAESADISANQMLKARPSCCNRSQTCLCTLRFSGMARQPAAFD